ncbi:MAG: DUF2007 domain-containing protein [Ignavibacteria bacterium]|nr:DUF2007 domain-containing protein [Ignavibacteria bacterium]
MEKELVVIAQTTFSHEAHMLISVLAENGVEAFIGDEQIVNVLPSISGMAGGVKVRVRIEDVQIAKKILDAPFEQ